LTIGGDVLRLGAEDRATSIEKRRTAVNR